MKHRVRQRVLNLGLSIISLLMVVVAVFYFEKTLQLDPCPYCILQRAVFLLLALLFLLMAIFQPKTKLVRLYSVIILGVSGLGLWLSGKHSWMQLYPTESFDCRQTVASITDVFNIDSITDMLSATGSCNVIEWTFLGLSIPMWTFVAFFVVGICGIINNWITN